MRGRRADRAGVVGRGRSCKAGRAELPERQEDGAMAGQPGRVGKEETCRWAMVKGCSDCGVEDRGAGAENAAGRLLVDPV